jgi:hypothetical protein
MEFIQSFSDKKAKKSFAARTDKLIFEKLIWSGEIRILLVYIY